WRRLSTETSSKGQFPANRENNRDFGGALRPQEPLAANHAPHFRQCPIDVCCIRANPEPEAKAVAAVIAVHVYFGKLCLNFACTSRLKGKKIAVLGLGGPWRNQIRKPQSLDVLGFESLDE